MRIECALFRVTKRIMPLKERRKGKKEIHKGNIETLKFYWKFAIVGTGIQVSHILLSYIFAAEFSRINYVFLVFSLVVQTCCYVGLQKMAAPDLGPNGELIQPGMDLSETYFSEYMIDLIILTAGVQILSAFSNYMWLLWLAGPFYLLYKAWRVLIWPWITAGPAGSSNMDEPQRNKRQKIRRVH